MKTIFTLLLLACFVTFSFSQSGALDRSFGDTGIVLNKNYSGVIYKIAFQSDGKIIAAGAYGNFLMLRYNSNGSVDSSFGINGTAGKKELSQIISMAVLPDDKIIAVGQSSSNKDVKVVRYKKDGSTDSSFGKNGQVVTNISDNYNYATDVIKQSDGKIVVAGYIVTQPNESNEGFLIRYLPDGVLDKTFDDSGVVIFTTPDRNSSIDKINSAALDTNGKIIVAVSYVASSKPRAYRFTTKGNLDSSFGIDGRAAFQSNNGTVNSFNINSLIAQPDGKIIGCGYSSRGDNPFLGNMTASRLNNDGSFDSSFGDNGITYTKFGNDASEARSILLQKDGKIITAGWEYSSDYFHGYFAIARFNLNGTIDSSFGNNGKQITSISYLDFSTSSLLQPDGKILLGGYGATYTELARYNNETKKEIIINKIKHYIETHNNIQSSTINKASIYPNPATNTLHIEGLSSAQKIKLTVVDITGNIKLQTVVNASSYNLNIATLQAGNYLLKIEMNGEVIIKQFVKE